MGDVERTEEATPRRREEARRRGQVARSQELTAAVVMLGGFLAVSWWGASAVNILFGFSRQVFARLPREDGTQLLGFLGSGGASYLATVAPLLTSAVALAVVANVGQVGFLVALQPLKPRLDRVNPLAGLRRMVSGVAFGEVVKAMAKVGIVGFVLYKVVAGRVPELAGLFFAPPGEAAPVLASLGLEMGIKGGGAFLVLAFLDYLWQKRRYEASLRMTRQELKEELKQTEGDPRLKARIRQVQRQWASRRMMHAVPRADVVIVNPVHYAVALRYEAGTMRAPMVVAKGRELLAERIKELARQYGVPVVENPPLAQALYRAAEVGMEIPAALYEAVAEVLAYVYRLRRRYGR